MSKRAKIYVILDVPNPTRMIKAEDLGKVVIPKREKELIFRKNTMYIAFAYKKTKSGHRIKLYERSPSALIAVNRLRGLLGD